MPERKKELLSYLDNICLFIVGILFIAFPVLFLSITTDAFVEPKELLLIILSSLALLIFSFKTIIDGKLRLRTSPFDLPITTFIIVIFVSAIFSVNRYDALTSFAPILFIGFLYFVLINTVKTQKQLLFLLSMLTLGASVSALLAILSFFKLYPLPFTYTHIPYFTTFGSMLDQALYYALVLPIAGYFGYGYLNIKSKPKKTNDSPFTTTTHTETHKKKSSSVMAFFGVAFIIIAFGLGITVYFLFTSQKPLILPFDVGFQTAFAAISQSNVFKNLLLGSGYGTYINDFTQFKPASYNANETLWAYTFFRSSSYALEVLATSGLLGIATFGFLIYRVIREKNFFLPLMLAILASLLLPFSFTLTSLLFILLALFAIVCIHNNPQRFGEAELSLLALRRGLISATPEHDHVTHSSFGRGFSKILPSIFLLLVVVLIGIPLYFITRFTMSDLIFQQSLVAESENNGLQTYQLQTAAITLFPYRDIYYRSYSQTNLALANALAVNRPKNSSPSAQTQKNILTLIQQSISAGRAAITVAPATSFNWNNLSSIYRSLIGFGQNADKFTISTLNQAIALDPNDPQQYIDLGGVYYQLGQYDTAIKEFEIAINLKNDYANAYYNLGHAYQEEGQYSQAMVAYQTVKQLVAGNTANTQKIDSDIATLNNIENTKNNIQSPEALKQASPSGKVGQVATQQQPITVNKPATTLPTRNPQASIPAPAISGQNASPSNSPSNGPAPTK